MVPAPPLPPLARPASSTSPPERPVRDAALILGVTGKLCAGKTAVAAILAECGFLNLDVDRLGHQALLANADLVASRFGSHLLLPDGSIDRRALGAIVFADSQALKALEQILHPTMIAAVRDQTNRADQPTAVDAALLYKMGIHTFCDAVLHVTAPLPVRLFRAMQRDHLPLTQVVQRIARQSGASFNPRPREVDTYIVRNLGSPLRLRRRVCGLAVWLAGPPPIRT